MAGLLVQINVSRGGIPKLPLPRALLTANGIEGDRCARRFLHGGPLQKLLLLSLEAIEQLQAEGYPVYPGALGENLTVRGLTFRKGDRLLIGTCEIELTKLRAPCSTLDVYGASLQQRLAGSTDAGFYAKVLRGGPLAPGMTIELLSAA